MTIANTPEPPDHLRYMDLTVLSGGSAVLAWKAGLLRLWQAIVLPRYAASRREVEKPPPAVRAPSAAERQNASAVVSAETE